MFLLCYSVLKPTHRLTSCTSTSCAWLAPSVKKVEYAPICDFDFITPKRRETIVGNLSCSLCTTSSNLKNKGAEKPTEVEIGMVYKSYLNARKCLHSYQLCHAIVMHTSHGEKVVVCPNHSPVFSVMSLLCIIFSTC